MPVLTLNYGVTPIPLDCQRAGHAAPRRAGDLTSSFLGAQDTSVRGEFMVVPVVSAPIPTATVEDIRALFALGAQVPCRGDVFNLGAVTVVCSGTITDELQTTADRWIVNLTLYEVGTDIAPPNPRAVYLANLPDDDTGAERKIWTTLEGGSANAATVRILNAATAASCAGPSSNICTPTLTDPDTPEVSFLSTEVLEAGYISGSPSLRVQSIGGTADKWATQNIMAIITVVRGGVDVLTLETAYGSSNGGFSGGQITISGAPSVVFSAEVGDRVRVRIFGRIGLRGGYTDGNDGSNLDRQTITYGYTGAGAYYSALTWNGLGDLLDPTP